MMQRYFKMIYWALLAYIASVSAASAAPVFFAALAGGASFGAAFGATTLGAFLQTVGGRLLASVAISALRGAMAQKPKAAGITTTSTATGGTNPVGFILGDYATAGDAVCPPMTHGTADKTPNAYLTYVIALGDIAGQTLQRIAINGDWVELATTVHADYGTDIGGKYLNYAWCKFHDGSQTTADPMLLAKYGSYPERPWLADMIGTGIPYVIMTFRYNREVFPDFPAMMFQCGGIKLYDPRKDSSIGGSGAHRWGQPATYQQSSNPIVQCYNIARGIMIAGIGVWGGDIEAADLPTASWFSAANTCDVTMSTTNGFIGSLLPSAQFSTGYEVRVDMEAAAVIEELLKGCVGQIAEVGGEFKVRVGGPGLPVMFLTDEDIVVSKAQDFDPFPQADGRQNGIDAKYPDPEIVWQSKSAPSLYNSAWELEDGDRRVVSLDLPAVPYHNQVQRIMDAYISDERRFRAHNMTLPPDAAILEPLDVISWTSARNSYVGKLFDLSQLADDISTLLQRVSVREVDASDFVFTGSITTIAIPSPVTVLPPAQTLHQWDVQPLTVTDSAGTARKPGIVMTWSATDMDAVDAVEYQVCIKASGSIIKVGSAFESAAGRIPLSEGIVQGVIYQARGRPVVRGRAATWTAWKDVTAPMVGISDADLETVLRDKIDNTVARTDAAKTKLDQMAAGLIALAKQHFDFRLGEYGWVGGYNQAVSEVEAAPYPSVAYADVTFPVLAGVGAVLQAGPATSDRHISERAQRAFVLGQKMRFRMKTRLTANPTTGSHSTGFAIAVTDAAGAYLGLIPVADFLGTVVANGWQVKEFVFEPQALKAASSFAATAANWRFDLRVSGLNAATQQVEWVETEDVTFEASAGSLFADIDNIKAVSVSALSGTALGTLLTQLNVVAGGTSTWVTQQSSAVANLTGYAAATYSLRIGAGGAAAGFEIVATDDPVLGAASTLKLSAQHIEILASSMRISDSANVFPDFDMVDPLFYSTTTAAAYSFTATSTASLGQRWINISVSAATEYVYSDWFPVEPSTDYLVVGAAWLASSAAGQGTATLTFETGSVSSTGVVTLLSPAVTVSTKTDLGWPGVLTNVNVTTAATARKARFKMTRAAGGAGIARFGGFKCQKKGGGILLSDGGVFANHIDTDSFNVSGLALFGGYLRSTNYVAATSGWQIKNDGSAEFNDLVVRENMIVDGATSRTGFLYNWASFTVSATTAATANVLPGGTVDYNPAPRKGSDGFRPDNPVLITVTGEIYATGGAGAGDSVNLVLQRYNTATATWVNHTTLGYIYRASETPLFVIRYVDTTGFSGLEIVTGKYRLAAWRDVGITAASLQRVICTMEQMNK